MAKPKMSTRRPKSVLDQERYTAELSTGQLVIGVCILLMFGLGCFLLGVLIGKFDPTLDNKIAQTDTANPSNGRATEVKVIESAAPRVSPPVSAPAVETEPPVEFRAPARILAAEALPSQEPPAPVEAPPSSSAPAVGESVQAEAERNRISPPSDQPQTVAAAPDASTASAPGNAPAIEVAPTPDPKPAVPAATTSEGWKGYGVQIMAVARGPAEAALNKLQAGSSFKGRVLPPARGELSRIVVGPYAERSAAMKARDDLLARGYKGAFVLRLQ